MTDIQQINASVLADWLECVKQMEASLVRIKKTDGNDIEKFSWNVCYHIRGLIPDLNALRALVAEQEQVSEWPAREVPPVVIADAKAAASQFEVGDTVIYDGVKTTVHKSDTSGIIVLNNGAWVTEKDLTLVSKAVKA